MFKSFQDCLDAETKRLTSCGVGATVKEAESLFEEQEEKLWSLGLFGDGSPGVLLDTMLFLIGKNFSLRSGREHRNLKFSQLNLVTASKKEPEKLVYVLFGEKNNLGGLKHRGKRQKRTEHYSSGDNMPERCLVRLYKLYVSKCHKSALEKDVFYVAPRPKYYFTDKGMKFLISIS